jgi:hypothetical protein
MGKVCGTYGKEERFGGETRRKEHLKDLSLDRNNILKWMIMEWNEKAQTGLIWLRIQTVSG